MRDKTHDDFIERWVKFMKENPDKWRDIHTRFINSQLQMNREFLERLKKTPGGREKIIKLYDIKNVGAYKGLLGY